MANVRPSEVTAGDIARHLVSKKNLPVGGHEGFVARGPVTAVRPTDVTPYGVPGTYLRFEDGHEAGPFIEKDRIALANR